ncbi:aldo/keto reductase [Singulisphaera sp. Ch08]|uniref:Aldo/keto reductase n=1 Tax=Singulisphaera sp. Ch08 TaxID=3120278 RepID=A0AAU7CLJ3_9BACT
MAHEEMDSTSRRTFLQTGALATASAMSLAPGASAQDAAAKTGAIPTRPLGKTGVNITLLDQGAVRSESLDRLFRTAFANGIRVFDTAKAYGTEPAFKKWFEQAPEIRKQIFLVTKDSPKRPDDMMGMVDERLASLGTDYIDLFFIHGLGDEHSLDDAMNFVKSQEFKEKADAIRKSGKAKFVGFSTHHKDRAQIIQAAADAGFVDAIMLQYTPWLDKDSALNKALDACWKKGIGLITMKQIAGKKFGDKYNGNILDEVPRKVPMLAERNLTPFQGLLHAIWTDERISASCVSMKNTDQIRENVDAARRFEPVKTTDILQLRDAVLAAGQTLCADCDGRCSVAAGTQAELGNLTRFLTYHEHHGHRAEARSQFASMTDAARDWAGADLEAARAACPGKLDFAKLLPEVNRHLA